MHQKQKQMLGNRKISSLTVIKMMVLVGLYISTNSSSAQSTRYFEKFYATPFPNMEEGWTVHTMSDGYILGCNRISSPVNSDILLIKTNLFGNILWELWLQDALTSKVIYGSVVVNDGVVFTGYDRSLTTNLYRTLLFKSDTSGNILWQKAIGDSLNDNIGRSIIQTQDGGFAISGLIGFPLSGTWEGYMIKTDSAGNVEWTRQYNGPLRDDMTSIKQRNDGTFIMTGVTNSTLGSASVRFIKTDTLGFVVIDSSYTFFNFQSQIGYSITESYDGGYIIGGNSGGDLVSAVGLVFKIDSTGHRLWEKRVTEFSNGGGIQFCCGQIFKLIEMADSNIIMVGEMELYTGMSGQTHRRMLLLKMDRNGNEIWRRLYSPNLNFATYGLGLDLTPDGGFIISCRSNGQNNADVYLVKTNCLGYTSPPQANFVTTVNGTTATFYNQSLYSDTCVYFFGDGDSLMLTYIDTLPVTHTYASPGWFDPYLVAYACGEVDTIMIPLYSGINDHLEFTENSFSIFPNPSSGFINVTFQLSPEIRNASIIIYDLGGRLIQKTIMDTGLKEIALDVSSLASGSYQIVLQPPGMPGFVRKLMVAK